MIRHGSLNFGAFGMNVVDFYKGLARDRVQLRERLANGFRILDIIARVNADRERLHGRLIEALSEFGCEELLQLNDEMVFLLWIFEGSGLGDVIDTAFRDEELSDDRMAGLYAYFISCGREVVLEVLEDSKAALRILGEADDVFELADFGETVLCSCNAALRLKRCEGAGEADGGAWW